MISAVSHIYHDNIYIASVNINRKGEGEAYLIYIRIHVDFGLPHGTALDDMDGYQKDYGRNEIFGMFKTLISSKIRDHSYLV